MDLLKTAAGSSIFTYAIAFLERCCVTLSKSFYAVHNWMLGELNCVLYVDGYMQIGYATPTIVKMPQNS